MCCSGSGPHRRSDVNHQQVRDIAEAAFKARFGDIGIVSIDVKPGLVVILSYETYVCGRVNV